MENYEAVKWLIGIRRAVRQRLNQPPFVGNEITSDEYEAAAEERESDPEYWAAVRNGAYVEPFAFFRLGRRLGNCCRFRVPKGQRELFDNIEHLLDAITKASSFHVRLRRSDAEPINPVSVDAFAIDCITVGQLAAKVGVDLKHRQSSRPRAANRKLTDPDEVTAASDEIKRQLRGKIKFTPATERAAAKLRSQGIEVSGRFLRQRFAELNPNNQA